MSAWVVDMRGSIAVLTFTRPPRNFMDFASMIELGDLLEDIAGKTDDVAVILLASGVDGIFIDHAELSDLAKAGQGRASAQELGSWARGLRLLEEVPQPTIAAIDGIASGGGNEIALACTLRLASERARLQQPEVTVGIIPGGGGSVRLPRLIGPGTAAEAIMTGRAFSAEEALSARWVNAVLPSVDFREHALRWSTAIAQNNGAALNAAKRSILDGSRLSFGEAQALEQQLFRQLTATSDALRAASA